MSVVIGQPCLSTAVIVDGMPDVPGPCSGSNQRYRCEPLGPTGAEPRYTSTASVVSQVIVPSYEHPCGDLPTRLVVQRELIFAAPALGEQVPHVPVAQRQAQIQPDRVPDDDGRELVASGGDRRH